MPFVDLGHDNKEKGKGRIKKRIEEERFEEKTGHVRRFSCYPLEYDVVVAN